MKWKSVITEAIKAPFTKVVISSPLQCALMSHQVVKMLKRPKDSHEYKNVFLPVPLSPLREILRSNKRIGIKAIKSMGVILFGGQATHSNSEDRMAYSIL